MNEVVLAGACVLASVVWLLKLGAVARHRGKPVWLAGFPDDAPVTGWPTLAVLVAARDEAPHIDRAVRSLLTQDYPGLEVIAVDDRSTDDTGLILDAIAAEDDRLRVIHVRELPPGWLGKTHALHLAAGATAADWLLFTDADVVFAPGTLRRAASFGEAQGVDHLSVVPDFLFGTAGERVLGGLFYMMLATDALTGEVEDPKSLARAGIGAFNLVRVGALRTIGGFEHVALSVDDDRRLGEALKASGHRGRVLLGPGAVEVRWHVGLAGLIRGVEKNLFALLNYRLALAAAYAIAITWVCAGPHAGLFVGPWWTRVVCALGVGAIAILMAVTGRRGGGVGWPDALVVPLGGFLIAVAMLHSAWVTLRRGGVRWRDNFYPLEALRAHVARRSAWLRDLASDPSRPTPAGSGNRT